MGVESKDAVLSADVIPLEDLKQRRSSVQSAALRRDQVAPEARGENLPEGCYWSPGFIGTLVATCLANISGYSGFILPANTIGLIVAELGPSTHAIWLILSFQAGSAVGFLLLGRLSDIFGRRWLFTGCSILAVFANIIGSVAPSVDVLIVSNSLNGIAASGQLSFSVVIGELVENKNRGIYNAIVQASAIPFSVFGPVIMRAFFQHTELTFRWCYIIGVVINTIAVVLYYFYYWPPSYALPHVGGKPWTQQMISFDWLGTLLFTSGLTVLLISLNWAGNEYSWSDGHALGAFFAGLAILVTFCVWEAYCPHEYGLMPMKLFQNFEYDAIVTCAAVAAMLYFAGAVLWPSLVEALFTQNVSRIGWLSCVVGGGTMLGQILAGVGVRYIPRMKLQMLFAGAVMMTFIAAIAAAKPGTEMRTTVFMLIGTTAAGYCDNLSLSTMALVWEPDDIGLVAGVLSVFRSITGSIATSMYSSILMSEMKEILPRYVGLAAIDAGLAEDSIPAVLEAIDTGNLRTIPGLDADAIATIGAAAQLAYSRSFQTVFLCTIPFGIILLVAAIGWVPNVENYMTDEVARKLQIGKTKTGASGRRRVGPPDQA